MELTAEFPFVEQFPKREQNKLERLWEGFENMKAVVEKHGLLVPPQLAADLLGVSRQRVHQLMEQGRMKRVEVLGQVFITEDDLHAFARSERKNGRPPKVQTYGDVAKLAVKTVVKKS